MLVVVSTVPLLVVTLLLTMVSSLNDPGAQERGLELVERATRPRRACSARRCRRLVAAADASALPSVYVLSTAAPTPKCQKQPGIRFVVARTVSQWYSSMRRARAASRTVEFKSAHAAVTPCGCTFTSFHVASLQPSVARCFLSAAVISPFSQSIKEVSPRKIRSR